MMRTALLLTTLLCLSAAPLPSSDAPPAAAAVPVKQVALFDADSPTLTLPAEVSGPVGAFISVPATTNGSTVRWHAIDAGLNLFPIDLLKDTRTAVVTSSRAGRYRLLAYTALDGEPSAPAVVTVVVGDAPEPGPGPQPDPDPGPEPGPTPDDKPPFDADGLHVLIVYESSDAAKLTSEQQAIIFGADVRAALKAACPETNGTDTFRIYDRDADPAAEAKVWQDAMAVPRESLPWLVLSNGKTGFSGSLDMTPADFKALIEKHK